MASKKKDKAEAPKPEPITLNTGAIEMVEIKCLSVSEFNVRKDATADDELIASIANQGLLQPLIGYHEPDHSSLVAVCAGQRRLLALEALVKAKRLAWDTPVPVRMVDRDTAIEISLAENLERKSMSPIDEFKAFAALVATGRYNEQLIADKFGFTRRYVLERLKLAGLHPEVSEALQRGEFGIEAAKCFCVVEDQEQQLAVYKQAKRANYDKFKPASILSIVNSGGLGTDTPDGQFIGGKKAYEKAGGTFEVSPMDDLFAKHSYSGKRAEVMKDAAIVKQLWEAAWSKASAALKKEAAERFGIDIANIEGVLHSPTPGKAGGIKAPSEHFKFETSGYDYTGYGHTNQVTKSFFTHALKKIIKEGGRAFVVGQIDHKGKPYVDSKVLYLTADMKPVIDKIAKDNAAKEQKQREAQAAERSRGPIERAALHLYWQTLTPEQKLEGMRFDRVWRQNQAEPDGGHFNCEFVTNVPWSLVEPFMAQAEADAEAAAKAKAAEQEAAEKAEQEAADAYTKQIHDFAQLPLDASFPHFIILEVDGQEVTASRKENGDYEMMSSEGDDWEVEASLAKEQMLDFARQSQPGIGSLRWFDTYGDYEATIINPVADDSAPEGDAPEADNDETTQPEPQLEAAE